MKKISLLIAAVMCLSSTFVRAQVQVVAESATFPEYEVGLLKVISLKSGETALLHFNKRDHIDFKMYDAAHQLKFEREVDPVTPYKMKAGAVLGVFETEGKITAIYTSVHKKIPTLHRLVLDPVSGKLEKDEIIGRLKQLDMGKGYAVAFGNVPMPQFFLSIDPESGCYAVTLYNTFESNRNKRVEIVHYNNVNQEIGRAYYQSPDNKYKYMEYLDMVVLGSKEVIVAIMGKNGAVSKGGSRAGVLLLGRLKPGTDHFDLQKLNYTANGRASRVKSALLRYNKHNGAVYLLTMEPSGQKKKQVLFRSQLSIIDSELQVHTRPVTIKKVQAIAKQQYKKESAFLATPQNLYINDDGSFSILFEEQRIIRTSDGPAYTSASGVSISAGRVRTSCYLGDVGVVHYDQEGNELSAYYIPKSQSMGSRVQPYMYHAHKQHQGVFLSAGYQFKSFTYIPSGSKGYVMFNDVAANQQRIDKKKPVKSIASVGDSEAFLFNLNDPKKIPLRTPMMPGAVRKEQTLALFSGSDYDAQRKLYTVVVTQPRKKRNNTRVVWMKVN